MGAHTLIKGGTLVREDSVIEKDILICDGKILKIGPSSTEIPCDAETIDASGCFVFGGLCDVHVHFREPGYGYKETILSGSRAAARGGYTLVCPMPNLNPAPDCIENLEKELEIVRRDAVIDVRPYSTITIERKGLQVVDIKALKPLCAGFSDDGSGVQNEDVMRRAMKEVAENGAILAAHCEDNTLLKGGYIHDGRYAAAHGHKGICSESEWGQIKRDLELAAETGCAYHVCHISTKESVDLIRKAKAAGVNVSCETGPHYLLLCEDNLEEDGRFKMNPPLRSAADRDALIEGILDGTIDMIATDHAPHSAEEKSRGLRSSAMGIVGLETAFALLYTHFVLKGKMGIEQLSRLMCEAPRRRFGFGGGLHEGESADLAIFEKDGEFTVNPEEFLSKGKATPFEGWTLKGKCRATIYKGKTVYSK